MEYLTLDEKTFVKANKIAHDLGYTADYVGQLCRSGKVEAKLVGRTWYVEESSMKQHRKGKYRSAKVVAAKALRKSVIDKDLEIEIPLRKVVTDEPQFTRHRQATVLTPRYSSDESELLPVIHKQNLERKPRTGNLNVALADAEEVSITSEQDQTEFEASELPTLRFKGTLPVVSADDIDENASEPAPAAPETRGVGDSKNYLKTVKVAQKETSHDSVALQVTPDDKNRSFSVEIEHMKKEREKRRRKTSKGHVGVTETEGSVDEVVQLHAPILENEQEISTSGNGSLMVLLLVFMFSVAAGVLVLSISHQVIVDDTTITNGYLLDIHSTISQIYAYIKEYIG